MFRTILQGSGWTPELSTLDALTVSGDLLLIRDQILRGELVRFQNARVRLTSYHDFAGESLRDGFSAVISRADALVLAPEFFGTQRPPDRWNWERLSEDITFRGGIYSLLLRTQRGITGRGSSFSLRTLSDLERSLRAADSLFQTIADRQKLVLGMVFEGDAGFDLRSKLRSDPRSDWNRGVPEAFGRRFLMQW